jgi:hypothetical protein
MALQIIHVIGPPNTGKTGIIHAFTNRYLKYARKGGDVLGVFLMLYLDYAIGVSGAGDEPLQVKECLEFLGRYEGLTVVIVASRPGEKYMQELERFRKKKGATVDTVETVPLTNPTKREIDLETNKKVKKIKSLMPGRR